MKAERRTREDLLTEAAHVRMEAERFHQAAILIHDEIVEETLRAREAELLRLAESLEAQAAKLLL